MTDFVAIPQISPEQETCGRCETEIPAGDIYYAFTHIGLDDLTAQNLCDACFAQLCDACGRDGTEEEED